MTRSNSMRLLFTLAALHATPALATNGMRMTGFGPVQDGMGGAAAAAPLDSGTIVTNPAGLAVVAPRVDVGATYFGADVKYRGSGFASGQRLESDRGAMPVPTVGVVVPSVVDERLTLGLGGFGIAGMGVDYGPDLYGGSTMTSYTNLRLAPAAAYRLTDHLSVGAAINVMYAVMEYEVAGGMGVLPRDAAGSFGLGATVGLLYRVNDLVSLGATYESRSFFQAFEFDVPAHQVMAGMNPDGTPIMASVAGGQEELDFDQPQSATLGVAVRPLQRLLLAADVQWIRWSETNGSDLPEYDTPPELTGASRWDMSWDDQVVLKLGAQWEATRRLTLRAGYNWGESPLDPDRAFENIAFPALAEHHFSAGAGLALGHAVVNVGASWSPEATIRGGNALQNLPAYETRMSQLAFDVGVAYRF